MAEYIECEATKQLKAEIQKLNEMLFWISGNESGKLKISDITEIRDSMLNAYYALQEQEVRHGYWIKEHIGNGTIRYRCSVCNGCFGEDMIVDFNHNKFCADCGAKMDS